MKALQPMREGTLREPRRVGDCGLGIYAPTHRLKPGEGEVPGAGREPKGVERQVDTVSATSSGSLSGAPEPGQHPGKVPERCWPAACSLLVVEAWCRPHGGHSVRVSWVPPPLCPLLPLLPLPPAVSSGWTPFWFLHVLNPRGPPSPEAGLDSYTCTSSDLRLRSPLL